jgi:two-component system phosphate regulon sensor histidine kinase PhoR
MRKYKFSGIIALMTLSLIGIIFVQLFWMHKAISIKEKQFDQQVNQALVSAVQHIERNQNAYFMSSIFNGIPAGNTNSTHINISDTDSAFVEFSNFWQKKTPNDNFKQKIDKDGLETIEYTFDTIIETGNRKQLIQTHSQITKPKNNNIIISNKTTTNKELIYNPTEEQISNIMEQMILEFSVRNISIEDRLSYSIIKPTIEFELKNFNIPLDFEYAIANNSGEFYNKLSTFKFDKKLIKNAYKTALFPNDILEKSYQLLLYFPNKSNYIINNLLLPFIISIVFTLIILITFYFTLRIIYNQKKVSEIKNDFINNMTHEFKPPIATISLAADTIINPVIISDKDKITNFIKIIKEENTRMNNQVESVLKMSLIDKRDFNLMMKPKNVHPLIEHAIKNIDLQIQQRDGSIETDLRADNDLLWIDETHFVNVIYNLLDNANKYTIDKAPKIKVSTHSKNNRFYLYVEDNGIGMSKDKLNKIFEKFYRVPTGNIHTIKGFGLGLSYVKVIIMQFGGNIKVKSKINSGSTFIVEIPIKNILN